MKGHAYLFLLKFTKRFILFHFTIKNGLHQREILSYALLYGVDNCMGDWASRLHTGHQSCISALYYMATIVRPL